LDFYQHPPSILTASLAKGMGAFGGVIAAEPALLKVIDMLGRQNINTSHLSPMVAAQGLFHLRYYLAHRTRLQAALNKNLEVFNRELKMHGLQLYQDNGYIHPIFSFCMTSENKALDAILEVFKSGFVGAFFPPPIAPLPTLRLSLHRLVPELELSRLAEVLAKQGFRPLKFVSRIKS
jgi:7-keto-8-aminopelargonate synthetase-like enzyme